MIILPTEKRFDWKNPPFILCLLIFLNTFLFFFYQSGDNDKIDKAINTYLDAGLLKREWRPYLAFLEKNKRHDDIQYLRKAKEHNADDYIAYTILKDKVFDTELQQNARDIYGDQFHTLSGKRQQAIESLFSSSSFRFGLVPNNIHIINMLSYQFMHGSFMHLFGNMFFLVICGFAVEAAIGHARFLLFYLLSGIAAGLTYSMFNITDDMPLIGASGSISGVMAMYLWVFRLKKIEFFYWFYVFVGYVRLPALFILPLYIGKEIFQYFTDTGSNIAFLAHAGGFVAGSLLMAGLLWWKPEELDEEYIEEDNTIDPFQQKLAGVYQAMESAQFPLALKRLNELTDEYEETFTLSLLQLMKIHKNKALIPAIKKIFSYNKLNDPELQRADKVWQETDEMHNVFSEQELLKIGMRLSAVPDMKSAENIFASLLEKKCKDQMMGVLARKLAINFERLSNKEKSAYYTHLADASLGGA